MLFPCAAPIIKTIITISMRPSPSPPPPSPPGMDRSVSFGWYARRVTPWATAGYLAGLAAYVAQQQVMTAAAAAAGTTTAAEAAAVLVS